MSNSTVGSDLGQEESTLIEAAYRALASTRSGTVSVAEILAEAGLSTRAFYRHFRSKDDLFLAMFRSDARRVIDELERRVERAGGPAEALEVWLDQSLALTYDRKRFRRVQVMLSDEARRARGYAEERARIRDQRRAVLVDILRRGRTDGSFPNTDPEGDAAALDAIVGQLLEDRSYGVETVGRRQARARTLSIAHRALGVSS